MSQNIQENIFTSIKIFRNDPSKPSHNIYKGFFRIIKHKKMLKLTDAQRLSPLQKTSCPLCRSCSWTRGQKRLWGHQDACPQDTRGCSSGLNASEPHMLLQPSALSLPFSASSCSPWPDLCNRGRGQHHQHRGTPGCNSSWSGKVTWQKKVNPRLCTLLKMT